MKLNKKFFLAVFTCLSIGQSFATDVYALRREGVVLASEDIDPRYIDDFMREYSKFPEHLKQEIIRGRGTIKLIEGRGVTEDPTWNRNNRSTTDGRSWDDTTGAGGAPYANVPTRIVVNRLHDRSHGSSNLVLHEHAHSLDSLYRRDGISTSQIWKDLMDNNRNVSSYLHVCGSYCNYTERERFAELFSLYYDSSSSRREMEEQIPEVAAFFANLTSVRDLGRNRPSQPRDNGNDREERRQDQRQENDNNGSWLGRIFGNRNNRNSNNNNNRPERSTPQPRREQERRVEPRTERPSQQPRREEERRIEPDFGTRPTPQTQARPPKPPRREEGRVAPRQSTPTPDMRPPKPPRTNAPSTNNTRPGKIPGTSGPKPRRT